uniref:Uncharacterized protein n=1 Tax=Brassica oleracea var. oleracea TaxID=109376 RepID=A0A0D3AC33_BRAOL
MKYVICAKRLGSKGSTQPLTRYRCKASNRTRRTVRLNSRNNFSRTISREQGRTSRVAIGTDHFMHHLLLHVNSWLDVDPLEQIQLELDEEGTEILNESSHLDTVITTAKRPRKENCWAIRTKRVGTNDREQGNNRSDSSKVSKTSKGLWTSMDPSSLAILHDILHPLQTLNSTLVLTDKDALTNVMMKL